VKGLAETGLAAGAAGLAASHFTKKKERRNAELNRHDDHRHGKCIILLSAIVDSRLPLLGHILSHYLDRIHAGWI
jgi:hypothetical protein